MRAFALAMLLTAGASMCAKQQSASGVSPPAVSPSTGTSSPTPDDQARNDIVAGALTHKVDPKYPDQARGEKIEGAVVMQVVIANHGKIRPVQLVSGDRLLAAAAMKAVRRSRYEPYRLQGEPVEVKTNVTVNFKLSPQVNPCRESTSDSPAAVEPGTGVGYGTAGFIPDPLIAKVGPGITPPKAIYAPDPKYSGRAQKAKYQGTVLLWAVVGADGRVQDLKVARSLGMGLDENAVAAVCKWKFKPAMKDSQPIPVQINVEVNFRLD